MQRSATNVENTPLQQHSLATSYSLVAKGVILLQILFAIMRYILWINVVDTAKSHLTSTTAQSSSTQGTFIATCSNNSCIPDILYQYKNLTLLSQTYTVCSAHLKLIKWKSEKGDTKRFYLMDHISHKWQDIGELLDISHSQLESITVKHHGDPKRCCREVLGQWLDHPPDEYPTTWQGLFELLEDSQLGQIVSQLRNIVDKAIK